MNNSNPSVAAVPGKKVRKPKASLRTEMAIAETCCRQYREYIAKHYHAGHSDGHISYLLTQEDIDELLQSDSSRLNGIRIYIGHEDKGKGPLVRLFMVGCRENEGRYDDVLDTVQPIAFSALEGITAKTTSVSSGRPCPSECGGTNRLNS